MDADNIVLPTTAETPTTAVRYASNSNDERSNSKDNETKATSKDGDSNSEMPESTTRAVKEKNN
jgi:hypothetical protein